MSFCSVVVAKAKSVREMVTRDFEWSEEPTQRTERRPGRGTAARRLTVPRMPVVRLCRRGPPQFVARLARHSCPSATGNAKSSRKPLPSDFQGTNSWLRRFVWLSRVPPARLDTRLIFRLASGTSLRTPATNHLALDRSSPRHAVLGRRHDGVG